MLISKCIYNYPQKISVHEVDITWKELFNDFSRSFTVLIELTVNISLTSVRMAKEFQEKF